jgi:acetate kinase
MPILVVNAGSSSLKVRLLDQNDALLSSEDLPADAVSNGALNAALDRIRSVADGLIGVVAHRIVHGGTAFSGPVTIDHAVRTRLGELTALAPLHQPKSLAALDAVTAQLPGVPAVACFDTAFHSTLPAAAATYAVPQEWQQRYGVRRYGFHGLSHEYCTRRAAEIVGRSASDLRIVSCHLGAGASLAAVVGGRSVDTTMGFTPLEGLVMATRSGSVDPGLVLWLEEHEHLTPHEVATALEHRSGMLALAGTADMREVETRAADGDNAAKLALDVFLHRLVTGIGAMTAAAGGLDVLSFTGGIGEHSPGVRRSAAERLGFLGVGMDPAANKSVHSDQDISAPDARVRMLVIEAREDVQMAREARGLLTK